MDIVTSNVLTDIQTPSRALVNIETVDLKYSSKSINRGMRSHTSFGDDQSPSMGSTKEKAYDSGIVSIEIDNQKKNSKKARQTDRMLEKKIEQLGHMHRQSLDKSSKMRQQSEQSNQRSLQLRKTAHTDKKKRFDQLDSEDANKPLGRHMVPTRQQKSQLKPKST